jgi:4-amino-4-deoxy-L-arabinose transferase-like glycosyltransferase
MVLVDFGSELYIPWQLAKGKLLYHDVMSLHGPFSFYFNAILFKLFGTHYHVIIISNIVFVLILITLILKIGYIISDRTTAVAISFLFILVFAFNQYVGIANYNYISPYSHNATHGLIFSIFCFYLIYLYQRKKKKRYVFLLGLISAVVFLTKPEIFIAAITATAFFSLGMLLQERPPFRKVSYQILIYLTGFFLPLCIFYISLPSGISANQKLTVIFGGWIPLFKMTAHLSPFYKWGMGTDNLASNIKDMFVGASLTAAFFIILSLLSIAVKRHTEKTNHLLYLASIVLTALLIWFLPYINWNLIIKGIPLITGSFFFFLVFKIIYSLLDKRSIDKYLFPLMMVTFSMCLLLKMIFNVRIYHYGFVLAMPAILTLSVVGVSEIPRYINNKGAYGFLIRSICIVFLTVFVFANMNISSYFYSRKNVMITNVTDKIIADERGNYLNPVLASLKKQIKSGDTLAVLPDGVMVNYLLRVDNPTPYIDFMPPVLHSYGEDSVLKTYQNNPPDYILLVERNTSEYGYPFFGRDYAKMIYQWIQENYHEVEVFGNPPFTNRGFGLLLLKKKVETSFNYGTHKF